MKPPSPLAAKPTPGSLAASISAGGGESWCAGSTRRGARRWRSAWAVHVHRQGDPVADEVVGTPGCTNASSASVCGEHPALVVDQGEVLAVGVDHGAELGAGRLHQVGDLAGVRRPRRSAMAPTVEAYGLTASTSAPSLASTLGMTKLVAP